MRIAYVMNDVTFFVEADSIALKVLEEGGSVKLFVNEF